MIMKAEVPPQTSHTILRILIVFVVSMLLLCYCSSKVFRLPLKNTVDFSKTLRNRLASDIAEANPDSQGEPFDMKDATQYGKTTIIELYSLFSPQCQDIEPKLEVLARGRMDLAVRKLNIDRVDKRDVDLDSPLAKQYKLTSVPAFMIFDSDEKLIAEGPEARRQVDLELRKEESK